MTGSFGGGGGRDSGANSPSGDRGRGVSNTGNGGGNRTAGGSAGRPGGVGNVGQVNSRPTQTSYGAPIHYGDGANPISGTTNLAQSPERWKTTVDRVDKYNSAARNWNSNTGMSVGNTLNAFAPMGFSMQAPEFNQPATYTGGDYHLGVNPAGLAVGLGSMAAGVPGPWGSIAGKAYNTLGFHDLVLGGPDVPKDWTKWGGSSLPGASMTGAPSQSASGPPQQQAGGFHNTGGGMAAFPSTPAPFGQQPAAPAPGTPAPGMPAFPTQPKIANHTLPQGYESLFPNSLTPEDKALLYGKALMS